MKTKYLFTLFSTLFFGVSTSQTTYSFSGVLLMLNTQVLYKTSRHEK
ncbi:MAG: hypothetical protein JKY44_00560 [Flavobacteriaceae bacterium]|nr:hypothetical protein [Flavobacteriaceae bacterium]